MTLIWFCASLSLLFSHPLSFIHLFLNIIHLLFASFPLKNLFFEFPLSKRSDRGERAKNFAKKKKNFFLRKFEGFFFFFYWKREGLTSILRTKDLFWTYKDHDSKTASPKLCTWTYLMPSNFDPTLMYPIEIHVRATLIIWGFIERINYDVWMVHGPDSRAFYFSYISKENKSFQNCDPPLNLIKHEGESGWILQNPTNWFGTSNRKTKIRFAVVSRHALRRT